MEKVFQLKQLPVPEVWTSPTSSTSEAIRYLNKNLGSNFSEMVSRELPKRSRFDRVTYATYVHNNKRQVTFCVREPFAAVGILEKIFPTLGKAGTGWDLRAIEQ